jgi:hypothetical protein
VSSFGYAQNEDGNEIERVSTSQISMSPTRSNAGRRDGAFR